MSSVEHLMWFRNDLRIHDNPALVASMTKNTRAVYFWCEDQWQDHNLSPARLKLTADALNGLAQSLAALGVELEIVRLSRFSKVIDWFAQHLDSVNHVFLNAEYALDERRRDRDVKKLCNQHGVGWHPHHGSIMQLPGQLKTGAGQPYKVFTPFKKSWQAEWSRSGRAVVAAPKPQSAPIDNVIADLSIVGDYDRDLFPANETAALARLDEFVTERGHFYKDDRDLPAVEGTSRLSAALVVGLVSPIQCLHAALRANNGEMTSGNEGLCTWISELVWRDFYLNVIYSWPHVCKGKSFKPDYDAVAWRYDKADFQKWCEGETGFPLVDAAMKQLNTTGWMHNRLRMVTAMFLSKYLLIDWRWGEQYFMQHLVDGHFASNNSGWQWSASTGTDAAPYFRLLSPVRQAERFDPDGVFTKQFLPQLKDVPAKALLKPGSPELLAAGYPAPMIDTKIAREACLTAFKSI